MKFEQFEDMNVWQESRSLANECYAKFRNTKDYFFKDQILRAVVSIMNNIAEGFERKGNKEFKNFLFIAKGSCAEVRSMLYLSLDLKYLSRQEFDSLFDESLLISKMLSSLIKTL